MTIPVPGLLREYCDGAADLSLPAASVGAALNEIERCHPSLYHKAGDVVTILPAISGG